MVLMCDLTPTEKMKMATWIVVLVCLELLSFSRAYFDPAYQLDRDCGLVSPINRILNGRDSIRCDAPWQVSLRRRSSLNQPVSLANSRHVCGGTLIHRQFVLTTPFCAYLVGQQLATENIRDNLLVVAGDYKHTEPERLSDGSQQEQTSTITNYYLHRDFPTINSFLHLSQLYNSGGEAVYQSNAFMLLRLSKPMVINSCVRPACLPKQSDADCPSTRCKITGWGYDQNRVLRPALQEADMTLFSRSSCEAIQFYINRNEKLPARSTCARGSQGAAPCVGDQGGPLVCSQDNRWTLQGSILVELNCSDAPVPVSDITKAVEWIRRTVTLNL